MAPYRPADRPDPLVGSGRPAGHIGAMRGALGGFPSLFCPGGFLRRGSRSCDPCFVNGNAPAITRFAVSVSVSNCET